MGEKLAGGNIALALLANTVATGAVTLARGFTDTFAGIRPLDAPGFVIAQLLCTMVIAADAIAPASQC